MGETMYDFENRMTERRWKRQDRSDHLFRLEIARGNRVVFVLYGLGFLLLNSVPVPLPLKEWITGHLSLGFMIIFFVLTEYWQVTGKSGGNRANH